MPEAASAAEEVSAGAGVSEEAEVSADRVPELFPHPNELHHGAVTAARRFLSHLLQCSLEQALAAQGLTAPEIIPANTVHREELFPQVQCRAYPEIMLFTITVGSVAVL